MYCGRASKDKSIQCDDVRLHTSHNEEENRIPSRIVSLRGTDSQHTGPYTLVTGPLRGTPSRRYLADLAVFCSGPGELWKG